MAEFTVKITLPHNHLDSVAWEKIDLKIPSSVDSFQSEPKNIEEAHARYIKDLDYVREKAKSKPLGGELSGNLVSNEDNEWFWKHTILFHKNDAGGYVTMSITKFRNEGDAVNFRNSEKLLLLLEDYNLTIAGHVEVYKDGVKLNFNANGTVI